MSPSDFNQYSFSVCKCRHLRDFYAKLTKESRSYSIKVSERLWLDIEIDFNESTTGLIVFSGAKRSKDVPTPFFSGKKIEAGINTVIRISDPIFYLDSSCLLGWYSGTSDFLMQEKLPLIIREIYRVLDLKRLIFFGGSGGGWASLFYASFFSNSYALVFNPQTNIATYPAEEYGIVNHYSKLAFGCDRLKLREFIEVDLGRVYARSENKIIYMQNISDSHSRRDCKPFVEGFGIKYPNNIYSGFVSNNFYLHLSDWATGHNPPPKKSLEFLLKAMQLEQFVFSNAEMKNHFIAAEKIAKTPTDKSYIDAQ